MDQKADDLQQSMTETRHDIEETRASMTEKLELLEERVRETIEGTKSAVEDMVENVKGTVDETVEAVKGTVDEAKSTVEDIVENVKGTMDDTVTMVKQSFDLPYQVEQHPWLMLGGSVLVGCLLGGMLSRRSNRARFSSYIPANTSPISGHTIGSGVYSMPGEASSNGESEEYTESRTRSQSTDRSRQSSILGQFQDEFDLIKSAIIGTLMSTVREMIKQNMPSVAPYLEKAINSATTKLGAQPFESTEQSSQSNAHSRSQAERHSSYRPSSSDASQYQRQPYTNMR